MQINFLVTIQKFYLPCFYELTEWWPIILGAGLGLHSPLDMPLILTRVENFTLKFYSGYELRFLFV